MIIASFFVADHLRVAMPVRLQGGWHHFDEAPKLRYN